MMRGITMNDTRTAQGVIWVCIDCTISAVNDEQPTDRPDTEPALWSLWPDAKMGDITHGMMSSNHGCDYPAAYAEDCDCEHDSFSWTACGGCGSTLGGTRDAFTWWA